MASAAASDIVYQDEDVCILLPDSKRGVPVFHVSKSPSICTDRLYSHNALRAAHPELSLTPRHHIDPFHDSYIFFRAPYNYSESNTFEEYFGQSPQDIVNISKSEPQAMAVIRVDPEKTYVYFSEARIYGQEVRNIVATRMKFSEYLILLKNHVGANYSNIAPYIIKSAAKEQESNENNTDKWYSSNRFWEVVVKLPYLVREHYDCYTNDFSKKGGRRTRHRKSKRKSRKAH